jgi:nucleotide-binding universal stress UspA family protein
MIEIRTILCPIDFSDYSRRALQYAVAIARGHKSTLVVLHVNPARAASQTSDLPISGTTMPSDLTAEVSRFVQAADTAGIPVEVVVRKGTVVDGILELAAPADLLVMGTHGRSGFDRLILGSTTEKVLRKADCPVLAVPRGVPDSTPAPVVFHQILCPIDFSNCSRHALNYALAFAQIAGARLTVLHVMVYSMEEEAPEMYETMMSDSRLGLADLRRRFEAYSRERLASAVADAVGAPSSVETTLAVGKPYREILHVAAEQHADLIVMGVHGRGPANLMFFGSTTNHVVRQAHCPVLTVRKELRTVHAPEAERSHPRNATRQT